MEQYGSKGNIIRITGVRYADVVVYTRNGYIFVVCQKEREGKHSYIRVTRKLPENSDLYKAFCRRTENENDDTVEILLPPLTSN
ncbi:hypothetical protein V3C99_003990 [Haemonchus contortus]